MSNLGKRLQERHLKTFANVEEIDADNDHLTEGDLHKFKTINKAIGRNSSRETPFKDTSLADLKYKSNILDEFNSDKEDDESEDYEVDELAEEDGELAEDDEEFAEEDDEEDDEEEESDSVNYEEFKVEEEPVRQTISEEHRKVVQEAGEMFNKEDEEYLRKVTEVTNDDVQKGRNIECQRKLHSSLIGLRIVFEEVRKAASKLPQLENFEVIVNSDTMLLDQKQLIAGLLKDSLVKMIQILLTIVRKSSFSLTETNQQALDQLKNWVDKADSSTILSKFKPISENVNDLCRNVFNIWYRKTQLSSFKTSTKLVKQMNNDYCGHIIENVEKNYKSILKSTQKKGENFKIIGNDLSNITKEDDDEIFNDADLYSHFLNEFLQESKEKQEEEDPLNFLNKKRARSDKVVDRKASKNRKIRYDIHEKLVNFMLAESEAKLIDGRDEIVRSLFMIEAEEKATAADIEII